MIRNYRAHIETGTPFPDVTVNSAQQERLNKHLTSLTDKLEAMFKDIDSIKDEIDVDRFVNEDDFTKFLIKIRQLERGLDKYQYQFWMSLRITVGHPEFTTNHTQPVEQCKSKSSTKMS